MPSLTGGGASSITGAQIVDGSISDADISATAAIAASKILGLIGNPGTVMSIESTSAVTASLTTVANQRVLVLAFGYVINSAGVMTQTLSYNGVAKHQTPVATGNASFGAPIALAYSEIPGAGTHNITLTSDTGAIGSPIIIVVKMQVA